MRFPSSVAAWRFVLVRGSSIANTKISSTHDELGKLGPDASFSTMRKTSPRTL
jgi:hypothetical protein